jgi:hypothetical protein
VCVGTDSSDCVCILLKHFLQNSNFAKQYVKLDLHRIFDIACLHVLKITFLDILLNFVGLAENIFIAVVFSRQYHTSINQFHHEINILAITGAIPAQSFCNSCTYTNLYLFPHSPFYFHRSYSKLSYLFPFNFISHHFHIPFTNLIYSLFSPLLFTKVTVSLSFYMFFIITS